MFQKAAHGAAFLFWQVRSRAQREWHPHRADICLSHWWHASCANRGNRGIHHVETSGPAAVRGDRPRGCAANADVRCVTG